MSEEKVIVEDAVPETKEAKEPKQEVAVQNTGAFLNYMDASSLNKVYKNAMVLSKSDLMPDTYKNKPENVLIAMDMASRSGFGLMLVLQNLFIVKGKPAWSGQFCVAAINGSGKYKDIKYVWVGEKNTPEYGCYMQATDKATGETIRGSLITNQLVKSEGWLDKPGSKWKTMPEQMFKYRAAAFFARTECPEVLMGLQTVEEVKDVGGYESEEKKKTVISLDAGIVEGSYKEVTAEA